MVTSRSHGDELILQSTLTWDNSGQDCKSVEMIEWNIQPELTPVRLAARVADRQKYHTLLFDENRVTHGSMFVKAAGGAVQPGGSRSKGFVSIGRELTQHPSRASGTDRQRHRRGVAPKLVELNNPQYRAACFILADARTQRILKVQSRECVRDNGFCLRTSKTGDVFTIVDANLQLDQLDQVQRDVASLPQV
jgi:hypothetical protein